MLLLHCCCRNIQRHTVAQQWPHVDPPTTTTFAAGHHDDDDYDFYDDFDDDKQEVLVLSLSVQLSQLNDGYLSKC